MKQYLLQPMLLRTFIILTVLLITANSLDSLCLQCSASISGICISCPSNQCVIYSTIDNNTGMCSCNPGYYLNSATTNTPYCDRCFIGCLTCTGPLATNCITCANAFTYDSNTSKCILPNSITDYTVQQAYYFYGFNLLGGWYWDSTSVTFLQSGSTTYTTGSLTLVGLGNGQFINTNYPSGLQTHFNVRIMFAHYMKYTTQTSINNNILIKIDNGANNTVPIVVNNMTSNNPSLTNGDKFIQTYVDVSYPHSATSITISITTSGNRQFGIKQFILILKLCNNKCSSCNDYYSTNCTACVDSNRISNHTGYINQCVCFGLTGVTNSSYYQEQIANTCVLICPSLPVQTFGENVTRKCVAQCPNDTYAFTDVYRCWSDCPTTSNISSSLLFKDKQNWRCVPNCPTTSPYACQFDRICYNICPNLTNATTLVVTKYYAVQGKNPRCVSECPYNATFWLFGYLGNCIPRCPNGFWGDPITKLCLTDCNSTSAYPYKDNSSGINVCVSNCSQSNYFRNNISFTCVLTCPDSPTPLFGQTNRQCVTRCANNSFGLPFGNRKCVSYCPDGYWGEPDNNVCVNSQSGCKTSSNNRYADNYTRTCVFPTSCSLGYFADNLTQSCVSSCPSATTPPSPPNNATIGTASVGDPVSKVCQHQCYAPYYADYVAGLCVTDCLTNGTYADDNSNRSCVVACNTSGATPWADPSNFKCVSICNSSRVSTFVSDNVTWTCVFDCPPNYYADRITTNASICRAQCSDYALANGTVVHTYADNSTGTGTCQLGCSTYPPRFGDWTTGLNLCVPVCPNGYWGDTSGLRQCLSACPTGFFAQNDSSRQCVLRCKPGTYGQNKWCNPDPQNCSSNTFANDQNNLCDACNETLGTFGDPVSKRCVRVCPVNNASNASTPTVYYADISVRRCVLTCNASYVIGALSTVTSGLFGNNNTKICVFICEDLNSYAEVHSGNPYRVCVAKCFQLTNISYHYANNETKVCGISINCPLNQYGENVTQTCVEACPTNTFAYKTSLDRICIDVCPQDATNATLNWFGDISTSINVCVLLCPAIPPLYADPTTKLCVSQCPSTYYADSTTRTCVKTCPLNYYAYQPTRVCMSICPNTYFANVTILANTTSQGRCVSNSTQCGVNRWGDPYLHKCVTLCTGPNPVSLFAYWPDCVSICPPTYYSDISNGGRNCIQRCPATNGTSPDLYGDPSTLSCVTRCVTPLTWADYQTRLCQPICSAAPIETYSQNFNFRCVISLNCPTTPSITYGDNNTRSCVSNCSLGKFGDPTTRNCVTQCPNITTTGTSTYYADTSTGQFICVVTCPILPSLFGRNDTNRCVLECPIPTYGDQTTNRTCVTRCPIAGAVIYFAQNTSRICVTVCRMGTWGYAANQQCVETPFNCFSQWADNTTNLCVTTCPATANSFGDPTTKYCVTFCPSTYYSDYSTRLCVNRCPDSIEEQGTFGNNQTRVCQQQCKPINKTLTFADPQTANRYCVLNCTQIPAEAFADPSTKSCVPVCPVFPDLYAQTVTFTCVSTCPATYYADTNTRRCQLNCPVGYFKTVNPNVCVAVCPADGLIPMFGDTFTKFCNQTCSNNYFRYPPLSICIASCTLYSLFGYNMTCVKYCPKGYYANSSNICVSTCPSTTYGQNTTTTCLGTCITGFAYNNLCIAICPNGKYGQNNVCVNSCLVAGNVATNVTNMCVSNCTNGTYAQSGQCSLTCNNLSYADPFTNICSGTCTNGYYGDPTTNKCVGQCPIGYYIDAGLCVQVCTGSNFADNVTWSCTSTCSTGYWGYNLLCITVCPPNYYGFLSNRICYDIPNLPVSSPIYFADSITKTWVQECPLSPLAFGDRTLQYCIPNCLNGSFSDPQTRQCQTTCAASGYFADSTTNKCVIICPNYWYGNPHNGKCQDICANGYAYDLQHTCQDICPKPYSGYYNGSANICVLRCPLNWYSFNRVCSQNCVSPYYADNSTNQCVTSCVNSFASNDAWVCVPSCAIYPVYNLADNSSNMCVTLCPTDPDYYSQNGICVKHCLNGTFSDPTINVRKCTVKCTDGLFSDTLSGRCLASCPLGYWAQNVTNDCVAKCTLGFADNVTGKCMDICPPPTYADPYTKRCQKICTNNYFGQVNFTCVSKCTLYNYANPLTRLCEATCPPFSYLFAQNTTASCVANCSIVANSYADRNTNQCVQNCSLPEQYMLDVVGICTSLCPLGLFMQNSTKRCQPICTTGFAQPTTRYCVARCFGNPQTFGYDKVCHYRCLNASYNLYADNSTNLCVPTCPLNVSYFNDPLSGNCVAWCPDGYFSETVNRTCSPTCVAGSFADNLTRSCVGTCPTSTQQTYGQPNSHKCVRVCPSGMFARNDTKECVNYNQCPTGSWSDSISKYCVSRCPSYPQSFGLNTSSSCVPICPEIPTKLFGDFVNQVCQISCSSSNGQYRFADPMTRTCVFVCPIQDNLYGDTYNFSCVDTCSNGQLRDNSTQRCVTTCPSKPSYWADLDTMNCVYHCPINFFAQNTTTRLCISNCSIHNNFGDTNSRICADVCPLGYYADNYSDLCVDKCPSTPDFYADNKTNTCVYHCPSGTNWTTFADSTTRRCVTQCPLGWFAKNSTQRCVQTCDANQYADPIIRVCVADCTVRPHYYKHNNLTCIYECPTLPMAYKHNLNNSCVYVSVGGNTGCPSGYWANPLDSTCVTLCPDTYFADQSIHLCVLSCPLNTYADPVDRLCKSGCSLIPEEYRLILNPGTCVQFCPEPLYADNTTYNCVGTCPTISATSRMYAFNLTRKCVYNCPPPYYSYLPDKICVLQCVPGYFAQDSTRSCETYCLPPYYADDYTNRCVLMCPSTPNYYGHANVCVSGCPNGTYADNSTRLCVTMCPTQPMTFADNSTNKCVFNCPSSPNYYADLDNLTMKCVFYCPNGTFADVSTRTCVLHCPSDLMTYADPTTNACQSGCPSPYFASDQTKQCVPLCPNTPVKTYALTNGSVCLTRCPNNLFGQNITRTCATGCPTDKTAFADVTTNMCVSTCPYGWFADNDTFSCVRSCPQNAYADNYTRKCLQHCPGTQRLFSDYSTSTCVTRCPQYTYGNEQNWTCINNCPSQVFGYKLDLGNLCIQECPSPYFAFVLNRICVTNCGAGMFGNTATRICQNCQSTCPTCLSLTQCLSCTSNLYLSFGACVSTCPNGTYSNNITISCVYATGCPAGYYGNGDSKSCSVTCPTKQYANETTRRCQLCPEFCASCDNTTYCMTCVLNAAFSNLTNQCYSFCSPSLPYNHNGTCVNSCPNITYLDYTSVNCQSCNAICATCIVSANNCSSCDSGYLYNSTCISKCPQGYYAVNSQCQICTPNITSCSKPLTFNVNTVTENYQNVVYIQFNQATIIKGDPTKFISLNLNINRRLQSYSNLVNGGLPFTAQVMADGTIKLILSPGMTLTNPSFTISINDPNMITTSNGDTLQTLQMKLQNLVLNNYPAGSTKDAPLVVAGTILSIVMLIVLGSVFICTPIPSYLTLQAFQMIAFYAYVIELPPNLFYFLQKLSYTRLGFLPNMFTSLYEQPPSYFKSIPTRVIQVDLQMSFATSAGSYFFVFLIYLFVSGVVYILSSKINSNRPLRQLFIKIYNTRVKFGIINDFLWMFFLNVLVSGFMQFYYTENSKQMAFSTLSLIGFIALLVYFIYHRIRKYDNDNEQMVNNYRFWHEGVKEGSIYQYTIFMYYLRKVIFAIIIVSTISTTAKAQDILLISLSAMMLLALIILRPYNDHLRNLIHIANEVGLTFIGGAMLYYKHYVDILEPVGTKIICGTIITIVIIVHLSIALIWAIFRVYNFYKELYKDFKATQFFKLYLDQKYQETLEKQLQELNDETGEVQSVELTKVADEDKNEDEQIIRLKIKRKRKIVKKDKEVVEEKKLNKKKQGQYIKLNDNNDKDYNIEPFIETVKQDNVFELMNINSQEENKILQNITNQEHQEQISQQEWVQFNNKHSDMHSILSKDNQQVYQEINIFEQISAADQNHQIHPEEQKMSEIDDISSVSNKQEMLSKEEDHLRESLNQINQQINNQQPLQSPVQQPKVQFNHEEIYQQQQFQMIESQAEEQHPPVQEIPIQIANNQEEEHQQQIEPSQQIPFVQQFEKVQHSEDEPSEWQQLKSEQQGSIVPSHRDFIINLDENDSNQGEQKQVHQVEINKQQNKPNIWNMQIEDLLDEQQKKDDKQTKKKQMLLFDEQDFD